MNKFRFSLIALAVMAFTLMISSSAQAQATRTWVSGVGDDVNPCSRTAPCKTYAGAISKTAAGGEISTLDPGGFGAVTITKSMTIEGTHGQGYGSILASAVNGVNVNDSASGAPNTIVVKLRNLYINGAGTTTGTNGIRFVSGKALFVEDCFIQNFRSGTGRGIDASLGNLPAAGAELWVRNTVISDNSGAGIFVTATANLVRTFINNCRISKNLHGIHGQNGAALVVTNSEISKNATNGVHIENAAGNASAQLDGNSITANGTGVNAGPGAIAIRLIDNRIMINLVAGVNINGGTVFTLGDNVIRGNTAQIAGGALNTSETKQ